MSDRRTRLFSCLLALVLLLDGGGIVAAQAPATLSDERELAARAHFARGRDAYEHADFAVALDAFQGAYAITQHPKLLYNVGLASQKLGLVTDAITAFEGYIAWGEGDREEEVRGRIAALRDLANRDAAFVVAEPGRAPPPAVAAQPGLPREPRPAPAMPPPQHETPRRWWPYAVAGGIVAALAVAIVVPLARRDAGDPEAVMPNTGFRVEALWTER